MVITAAPRLNLFLALAVGCVLLLSLAWIWLGLVYIELLLRAVSSLVPDSVVLEQHGHEIRFMAQSETGATVQAGMHGMMMSYGLIVATSVLIAVPGIGLRTRALLLLATILTAFAAHVVGLHLLIQRMDSIAQFAARPKEFATLAGILTYVWLFVPSLVWLPLLLRQWQPWRTVRQ